MIRWSGISNRKTELVKEISRLGFGGKGSNGLGSMSQVRFLSDIWELPKTTEMLRSTNKYKNSLQTPRVLEGQSDFCLAAVDELHEHQRRAVVEKIDHSEWHSPG